MSVHQDIQAHLTAAERNPVKRAQHLVAATQHAEANDIPHFGRWSEQQVTRRNAQHALRDKEFEARHGTRERKEESPEHRGGSTGASAKAQPAIAREATAPDVARR